MTEIPHYTVGTVPPLNGVPVTLVAGVEHRSNGLRVYLGARWKNTYLLLPDDEPEAQEAMLEAWNSPYTHLWLWPLPEEDQLHSDKHGQRSSPTNRRKQKSRRNRGRTQG